MKNLQSGHFHERGVNNAETLQINLSCEEFVDDKELDYCIIKINDFSLNNECLYERVRKYWKVNLSRINKIPYVLASINGVVREVYKIEKWHDSKEYFGRCMFDEVPAPEDIRLRFVNKRLPKHYMTKGMTSPVLYKKSK